MKINAISSNYNTTTEFNGKKQKQNIDMSDSADTANITNEDSKEKSNKKKDILKTLGVIILGDAIFDANYHFISKFAEFKKMVKIGNWDPHVPKCPKNIKIGMIASGIAALAYVGGIIINENKKSEKQ